MQCAGMAVADGLLARCGDVDVIQRQRHFDQFLGGFNGGHIGLLRNLQNMANGGFKRLANDFVQRFFEKWSPFLLFKFLSQA